MDFGAAGLGLDYGTVRLAPATAEWGVLANDVARAAADALTGLVVAVEHVGSTSVPGLLAKPILDLALGLHPDATRDALDRVLRPLGWLYRGDGGGAGGLIFVLEDQPWHRVAHAHGVPYGGDQWRRYLRLRAVLRGSAAAREEYGQTKQQLAAHFPDGGVHYMRSKTDVVERLLAETLRAEQPRQG